MAKIKSILYISSYKDSHEISTVSKIMPFLATKSWQKGDEIIHTNNKKGRLYQGSNWSYEMPEIDATDINNSLLPLIEIIKPYKENLQKISEEGFEIYITLVMTIIDRNRPLMTLNKFVIDSLSELNCELSFDLYFDEGE